MTGDCCIFELLRHIVDGKHLIALMVAFSNPSSLVWIAPKRHLVIGAEPEFYPEKGYISSTSNFNVKVRAGKGVYKVVGI